MENRTLKLSITETECYEEFDKKNLRRILQILNSGAKIKKPIWSVRPSSYDNYDQYTFDVTFNKKDYCVIIRNEHKTKEFMFTLYEYGENTLTDDFKELSKYSCNSFEITFKYYRILDYAPKVYPTKRKKYPYGSFEEREKFDFVGKKSKSPVIKTQSRLLKIYFANNVRIDQINFKFIEYYFNGLFYNKNAQPTLENWLKEAILLQKEPHKITKHNELQQAVSLAKKAINAYESLTRVSTKMPRITQEKNPANFKVAKARFIAKQNIKNYIESGLENDLLFQNSIQ